MEIKSYLKEKQEVVYKTLKNSFKNNKTSHAYLISGAKGLPILQVAIFMAKSLICNHKDEDGFACLNCIHCKKVDDNSYADLKIISGEQLKTNEVMSLQEEFNKSPLEDGNVKVYIIDLIEKAPIASLNKLLKFIEEPSSNIVALFTTNSVDSILQTIVSRCQIIKLKELYSDDLVNYLISSSFASDDAYLIAKVSNDIEKSVNILNDPKYKDIKQLLKESLNYLKDKNDNFIINFQTKGFKILTTNDEYELFLDMLEACIMQALIKKEDSEYKLNFFNEEILKISKTYNHFDYMINDITNAKIDLVSNANKNLVFDKLLINLLRR
ncbi:MAG: hypothetical protein SOU19_05585 [Candidatus Caccosoma sp.]|nr:hypothetical protein [Candidatus Caccosoma sp.]